MSSLFVIALHIGFEPILPAQCQSAIRYTNVINSTTNTLQGIGNTDDIDLLSVLQTLFQSPIDFVTYKGFKPITS